ncbi:MAG: aldo/keto reductase [Nitrospinota bacterium]
MDRRKFLKKTAATTGATVLAGMTGSANASHGKHDSPGENGPSELHNPVKSIQQYGQIGKTGLTMSDISFGAGKLPSPALAERALDMGVNYFDTAPDYGYSETILGKFLKKRKADRPKIIITTKLCDPKPYPGHLKAGESVDKIVRTVEGSLQRLRTDYVDFLLVHALAENRNDIERLKDENLYIALDKLKKHGKIRYAGFSSHGQYNVDTTVRYAIDTGKFDMMLVAFNFEKVPGVEEHIKHAHGKGMGIVTMKTFAGAKHAGVSKFRRDGASFEQAALRWAVNHPEISGAIITIQNVRQLRHYVAVSGTKLTSMDKEILEYYTKFFDKTDCRIGCGECRDACPDGVNVPAILRHNMYYENYTDHKEIAIGRYAGLKTDAGSCVRCAGSACGSYCPYGLPVKELLVRAHGNLSIT